VRKRTHVIAASILIAAPAIVGADAPLVDPTRPIFTREATPEPVIEFTVTAILFSDERQRAVVNGRLVAEGDRVDGAEVMKIRPDALELQYRGETITRRLPTVELRRQ